ncbi:Rieske (2Fe-2S) protein [Belnapia rosea]|uniref:3-phenylpropionate/trans-cinnamate dioxygenase ferredoxin subunit n=1 Tax=Belnapia rosea TaxID=938405 RepID=A0A1G6K4Q1_9PROT|nr:Rieske 2Fe-2S domain-containing protein [Belnapia rosea]SDC25927.1 3-phenylpropionate/trans-cinnamate dioxygenase ferredoxin subunit [Belnapia rosea]
MARIVVAPVGEIPAGGRKLIEAEGKRIVVFNLGGEFYALSDRCPHQGGSLCAGLVSGHVESAAPGEYRYSRRGEMVRCPWHYWEFDIRTGKSWFDPKRVQVRQFPAQVASGATLVEGPYVAETFPVKVEDEYVVVDA